MSKHTPGPWLDIHDASEQASGVIRLVTAAGIVDASEDDIALMMQAPELLAALEDIIQRNEIQSWFNLDKARAVVAKVKGKQP